MQDNLSRDGRQLGDQERTARFPGSHLTASSTEFHQRCFILSVAQGYASCTNRKRPSAMDGLAHDHYHPYSIYYASYFLPPTVFALPLALRARGRRSNGERSLSKLWLPCANPTVLSPLFPWSSTLHTRPLCRLGASFRDPNRTRPTSHDDKIGRNPGHRPITPVRVLPSAGFGDAQGGPAHMHVLK